MTNSRCASVATIVESEVECEIRDAVKRNTTVKLWDHAFPFGPPYIARADWF